MARRPRRSARLMRQELAPTPIRSASMLRGGVQMTTSLAKATRTSRSPPSWSTIERRAQLEDVKRTRREVSSLRP
jgi:hypothetical protein